MDRFAERNAGETKKGEFLFVELPKNPSAVLPINRKTVCLAFGFPSIDYRFLGVFNLVSMIELLTLPVVETRGFSVLRGLPSGTDIVL